MALWRCVSVVRVVYVFAVSWLRTVNDDVAGISPMSDAGKNDQLPSQ